MGRNPVAPSVFRHSTIPCTLRPFPHVRRLLPHSDQPLRSITPPLTGSLQSHRDRSRTTPGTNSLQESEPLRPFPRSMGALRRAIYTVWGGLILRCAGLFSRFRNRTASVCPETSIFPSRKAGIQVRFKQSPHILFCNPLPHALSNTQSLRSMRSAAFTPARLRISWTRQTHAKPRLSSGNGA